MPTPTNLIYSEARPEPVAIVGAGPAGLTCAHYLYLFGHRVTVFEAEDRPGGMLTAAMPSYRLPRDVVKSDIQVLLQSGVVFVPNSRLGRDFTPKPHD